MKRLWVVMQSYMFLFCGLILLLLFGAVQSVWAQRSEGVNATPVVPPLVNFSGALTDVNGKPLTGTVGSPSFYIRTRRAARRCGWKRIM
jgi:hypothetical protein